MRKFQKKQAEDFINTLSRMHMEIKQAVRKNHRKEAMILLTESQKAAIALGNLIEESEGEGTAVISLLEEYCEYVYQIYVRFQTQEIGRMQTAGADEIYSRQKQYLDETVRRIETEIKIRREVVFLPYKASMWDSLESVWRAADADPDCDAYVVPIPYFDKLPDGSFGEMHYEVGLYPDDVPVVRYEDYDMKKRRPDAVFIHNPYDECNYVTSVLPFFYSKNLKQYTEQLIYIPYFILGEVDPENKNALEEIMHFCMVPGVINADKVIVQSEEMRRAYINIMSDCTKSYGIERKYWEEKILGLGSPKIDKVLNTKKEDIKLPEDWKKIISRLDGRRKGIVFYNTGVAALLQDGEMALKRVEDVFHAFYERKDELVLFWRPHPLIEASIKAMRPQLWEAYKMMVNQYKEEAWGIYDDSADLERALVLCDAYYGDGSSVMEICRRAGIPALLQK